MNLIFEAQAIWSKDHELLEKDGISQIAAQFSGIAPIHDHEGTLNLTAGYLSIVGETNLVINLSAIEQLFIGFDEHYHRNFVKNFGAFCQPLRIIYTNALESVAVYIIAGYNFGTCSQTRQLFNLLQELLS